MKPMTGHFFCVTNWSIYRITIPEDLVSRPAVQKWAVKITSKELGRDLHVPVGGMLVNGHHIAITSRGLFQYYMPSGHAGPPLPFEEVPGRHRGQHITQTTPIVGLFLEHRHAEECYERARRNAEEPFQPMWWSDTKKVLIAIGTDHPLVVISTSFGRFGVPRYLWNEHEQLPFVELSKEG